MHQSVTWPVKINHVANITQNSSFHILTLISTSAKIILLHSLKGKSFVKFMAFESTTKFYPLILANYMNACILISSVTQLENTLWHFKVL